MIDKSLCSDFCQAIIFSRKDSITFVTYANIVRNLIEALSSDNVISYSDILPFARQMVDEISAGFGIKSEQYDELAKYIIGLNIPFDDKTVGPIICSVNIKRYLMDSSGNVDYSKMTATIMQRNGYAYVVRKIMAKNQK